MLQGRTEMFNMNAFTEVLYKKKKPSLNDEHNSHINTNKLFYSTSLIGERTLV